MLTKEDVAILLQDMESDRIEWIISFREDKPGPSVCYLSNDFADYKNPGYILSGVEDDGRGANMKIGDAELQKIGNIKTPLQQICYSSVKFIAGGEHQQRQGSNVVKGFQ